MKVPSYTTNLNVSSNYSFLSSTISIKEYIKFAKNNNLSNLVLTDKNVMYGSYEFYLLCQENNIKPIIGLNCEWEYSSNNLITLGIFARNYEGYQTLIKISSLINTNNKKILTTAMIENHLVANNNIIIILAVADTNISIYQELFIFLKDKNVEQLYIGLNSNNINNLASYQDITTDIVPYFIVTYLQKTDVKIYQVLQAIKNQENLKTSDLLEAGNNYYLNQEEILNFFPSEIINKVETIIQQCNLQFPKLNNKEKIAQLPDFPCPNKTNSFEYLKQLCKEGLKKQLESKIVPEIYIKRLLYELKIINLMGFNDYFLIVNDYVQFAKNNNIMVGPGRGSVAGSLVAYVLGISDVDPIKYDLIFERFLNPERISLPDIDIDFQDERREEIIQYLAQKYGQEHVAHIVTFQTIASKMAIRDLGRVFNISLEEINEISKLILLQYNFDLDLAVEKSIKLKIYEEKYPLLFFLAKKIIGFPRQTSTHAAGVILSKKPLSNIIPIQTGFNNIYQSQYSMNQVEDNGLIKMDILGLRNLTILQKILQNVTNNYHTTLNLLKLPLDDKKTFDILKNGDTTGIFQLESPGMRNILQAMKTNNLEDIIASSSLFRPGPQEYIKTYINRKLGKEIVTYLHPDLKPYLSSTYGIIVYQEQVLLILQKIAGYSLAQADLIRRAIGKKDVLKMQQQETDFINAALKNGYKLEIITQIWEDIKQFAGYGFNRSHAVAYSLIGYWLAYLKANYPLAFMASLLTNTIGNDQKLLQYISECQKYNIKILPPSINYGQLEFSISLKENAIVYALPAIKQMSSVTCYNLITERNNNGLYKDFFEFCARANFVGLNKKNFEFLIFSGALDEINDNRNTLLNNLSSGLKYAAITQIKNKVTNSISLNLELNKPTLLLTNDNFDDNSSNEYKALGFYLKYNPEQRWKKELDPNNKAINLEFIKNYLNQNVLVLGKINYIKTIKTKNNSLMAFLTIENNNQLIEVTIFNPVYQEYQDSIQLNKVIFFSAKVDSYQNKIKLILQKIIKTLV